MKKVSIPLSRYEALLDLETRADVAVERAANDKYMMVEDILMILGTSKALAVAKNIISEREDMFKDEKL